MTTKTRKRVNYSLETEIDDEPVELETSFEVEYHGDDYLIVKKRPGGGYVVGYLCRDEDCSNPIDGMGKIGTSNRHHSREAHEVYQEALGLDSDWNRVGKRNPNAVVLDVYDHGGEVYAISNSMRASMFPDQRWDVAHGGAVWVPTDCDLDNINCTVDRELIQEALGDACKVEYVSKHTPEGKCITRPPREGEKPYFTDGTCIDERYSNVITVIYTDGTQEGGYKSFTTAYRAAMRKLGLKIDKERRATKFHECLLKYAEGCIEEFNKWLSGDCWGVCVDVLDAEGKVVKDDACWGFIGHEYALEHLKEEVEAAVTRTEKSEETDD